MTPNYTARKSIAATLNFWLILFFWLVIPLFIQIFKILAAKNDIIEFYDDKVVCKSGVLNKRERQTVFAGVYAVSLEQSLFGRMFNYGNLFVDCPGQWDIDTYDIKDPVALKKYLETRITARMNTIITN